MSLLPILKVRYEKQNKELRKKNKEFAKRHVTDMLWMEDCLKQRDALSRENAELRSEIEKLKERLDVWQSE